MKKLIFLSILSLCLFSATSFAKLQTHSDWKVSIETDDFTDEVTASAWSLGAKKYNDYKSIGLRCMDKQVYITYDVVSYVSSHNSYVMVKARVDKNNTNVFAGKVYSNSHSSGWLPLIAKDSSGTIEQEEKLKPLISEMKKGNKLLFEASNLRRSNIEQVEVSLSGFTKAYNSIAAICK